MKELAIYLVKSLVDFPERVEGSLTEEADATRVTLTVAEEDKGKVIGKQGKVIKAIRAVVGIAAGKQGRKVLLDLG